MKYFKRIRLIKRCLDLFKCLGKLFFRRRIFAFNHHHVDKLTNHLGVELGVGCGILFNTCRLLIFYMAFLLRYFALAPAVVSLGRFAPYFERDLWRALTPAASRVPRTI